MARKIITIYTDSLTGKEIKDTENRNTVFLALDNKGVELDLTDASLEKLTTALEPFFEAGEKKTPKDHYNVGGRRVSFAPSTGLTSEELTMVREWSNKDEQVKAGITPAKSRGRVPQKTVEAWVAAGKPTA